MKFKNEHPERGRKHLLNCVIPSLVIRDLRTSTPKGDGNARRVEAERRLRYAFKNEHPERGRKPVTFKCSAIIEFI